MGNDLSKLLDVWRFEIHKLVSQSVILKVPHINAEVVSTDKALTVAAHTERVYVVVVAVLELLALDTLVARAERLRLRKRDLAILNSALGVLTI